MCIKNVSQNKNTICNVKLKNKIYDYVIAERVANPLLNYGLNLFLRL